MAASGADGRGRHVGPEPVGLPCELWAQFDFVSKHMFYFGNN